MTTRRTLLAASAGAAALAVARPAWAAFPDRPLRFVIPFPPGGPADSIGRLLATPLAEQLGVPVVVDNKPGASTMIGAAFVAKAPPDGYTLLLGTSSMNMLVLRKQGSQVDARKDLAPIIGTSETVYAIMAGPKAPFKTIPELIAYAKANPGKVTCGNTGSGTTPHLVGEYLNSAAGIKTLAVPYKGAAPMGTDLMGGEIMVGLDSLGAGVNTLLASNKVTLLATTGSRRPPAFANVPTVAETLPGFLARGTTGVLTTMGTPPDVIDKLFAALTAVANRNDVKEKFLSLSHIPSAASPADYGKSIAEEIDKWGRVMQESGVVIE